MKGLNLTVLGFVAGFCLLVTAVEDDTPKQDWNSNDVTKLMNLLMKYGEKKLQEVRTQRNDENISQYLVASVLSKTEIMESKNWESLPDSITKDNRRVVTIVNDKNYKNFPFKTKKPLHGEVLLLLDRQDLPSMINNLKEEQNNAYPYVVLYSHYIPCCDIENIEYSCAEELAAAAISNHGKYTMLVGYNTVFSKTNPDKARKFMSKGGIKLFMSENGVFNPDYKEFDNTEKKPDRLLQQLFYECLDNAPISETCCTVGNNRKEDKQKILAMYINNVVFKCTTNKPLKSYIGKLTPALRLAIMQCIHNYADQHTREDCPYCPAKTTIYSIKVCALFASAFGTEIGRPSNLNDPYQPGWVKGRSHWGSLYEGYNVDADKNRPAVFCLKKVNSIKSLCTEMSMPEQEFSDPFQRLERRLKSELQLQSKRRKPK